MLHRLSVYNAQGIGNIGISSKVRPCPCGFDVNVCYNPIPIITELSKKANKIFDKKNKIFTRQRDCRLKNENKRASRLKQTNPNSGAASSDLKGGARDWIVNSEELKPQAVPAASGAGDGGRTRTSLRIWDFKSQVSANSTTPACVNVTIPGALCQGGRMQKPLDIKARCGYNILIQNNLNYHVQVLR